MPASRLTQWVVPRFRVPPAPPPSQWREPPTSAQPSSCPCKLARFSSSNARSGSRSRPRRSPKSTTTTTTTTSSDPSTPTSPSSPAGSIFEQLFPSSSPSGARPRAHGRDSDPAGSRWGHRRSRVGDDVAARSALRDMLLEMEGDADAAVPAAVAATGPEEEVSGAQEREDGPVMLVVTNGSRSTLPSDFYRVAPKGAHLDGATWSTMQAVQARAPETREPMDRYFLSFPSLHEAVSYKEELERLAAAGTNRTGDAPRLTFAPPDVSTMKVELVRDAGALRRIPGAQHAQDVLRRNLDTRNIVCIRLDGHQLTVADVEELVAEDGAGRNLAWKLSRKWGKRGIAVSMDGRTPKPSRVEVGEAASDAGGAQHPRSGDGAVAAAGGEGQAAFENAAPREDFFFSRFFLSFSSVHDARRFVRSWHRRPVAAKKDDSRISVVNASLVW